MVKKKIQIAREIMVMLLMMTKREMGGSREWMHWEEG